MDDALSGLLQDVRPQGALFDQSVVNPPWSLRFLDAAPLSLLTMVSGGGWVVPDGGEPVRVLQGDVAIVTGPEPYTVADDPGTPQLVLVHSGDRCTTPGGALVVGDALPMCGPGPAVDGQGGAKLLRGTFQVRGSVSERVLTALPRVALVPATPEGCPALEMIEAELRRDAPGRQVMLDRLLDLLLVCALREWFELPGAQAPSWYRAHADPVVGRALKLMHGDPARGWTVASLAAEAGVSRARFARRFGELVGQSPMAYLTEWRICRAADLLARTDATVDAVSRQVGYANAYALSVAFKRTRGIRPTEHRARARAQRGAGQGPGTAHQRVTEVAGALVAGRLAAVAGARG
ncbi:AraC family transcriptional regulator [Streptomyces lichenis]|uniref:AraC family transcriptional regulator n=1 Tax=Streptomyces lichenis TaxID=2306967 RepID=A0ABT0IAL2_9ACTN|nr:AraC family transcriptional regulator [Streptomyces lichenis]MCK8678367.1 AraC family transcriptional regulator [Streptomyces lichenis]